MKNHDLITKSFDCNVVECDKKGYFTAIASTEDIDRYNDLVKIEGIQINYPLPLLLEHKNEKIIGNIINGQIGTSNGKNILLINGFLDIETKSIANSNASLAERMYLRELAKDGQMHLSIGFYVLEKEQKNIDGQNVRILQKINVVEISFTRNPVNIKTGFLEMKNEDPILSQGVKELKAFYEELSTKNYNMLVNQYLNTLNSTVKRKEFNQNMLELKSLGYFKNTKNSIQKEGDLHQKFIKRCAEHYNKENKSNIIDKPEPQILPQKTDAEIFVENFLKKS